MNLRVQLPICWVRNSSNASLESRKLDYSSSSTREDMFFETEEKIALPDTISHRTHCVGSMLTSTTPAWHCRKAIIAHFALLHIHCSIHPFTPILPQAQAHPQATKLFQRNADYYIPSLRHNESRRISHHDHLTKRRDQRAQPRPPDPHQQSQSATTPHQSKNSTVHPTLHPASPAGFSYSPRLPSVWYLPQPSSGPQSCV